MKQFQLVFEKLWGSAGLRQSAILVVGSLFSMAISAVAIILISRILGPTAFGLFGIGLAVSLMLNRIHDFGLNFAIQKYVSQSQDKEQIKRILTFTTLLKITGSAVLILLGILFSRSIATALHLADPNIIFAAFLFSSGATLFEHLQAVLQALHRFSQVVVINVLQSLVKVIAVIFLTLQNVTASTVFLSVYLAAPLLPSLFSYFFLPKWLRLSRGLSFRKEKELLQSMASHSAVAGFSAGIVENVDILFVQGYLNTYEAGLFGGTARIALLFSLVAYAIGNVLNPRVARYQQKEDLSQYVKKACLLAAASLVGFLCFLPFAKWMLIFTIGAEYLPGLNILFILLAASFTTIATIPFMAMFFSLDAPWYFSVSGVLQVLVIVIGDVIFVPMYGVTGAAYVKLLSRLLLFGFTSVLALYLYHKKHVKTVIT